MMSGVDADHTKELNSATYTAADRKASIAPHRLGRIYEKGNLLFFFLQPFVPRFRLEFRVSRDLYAKCKGLLHAPFLLQRG